MMGVLSWTWEDIKDMSFRMLTEAYESKTVTDWDHTAYLAVLIHNLHCSHHNANSKTPMRGTRFAEQHPYRELPSRKITNIQDLKIIVTRLHNG